MADEEDIRGAAPQPQQGHHERVPLVIDGTSTSYLSSPADPQFTNNYETKEKSPFMKWAEFEVDYTLRECLLITLCLLFIGVVVLWFLEGWFILDSLYFTLVLLTTVGYGDVTPHTAAGKIFASLFALTGGVLLGLALGVVGSELVDDEIDVLIGGDSVHKSTKKNFGQKCWSTICIIVPISAPLIICYLEDWSWFDALYFVVVTATTIGFGDLAPTNKLSEICAILFIPFAVATMVHVVDEIKSFVMKRRREKHYKKLGSFKITQEDFDALDENGDEKVSEGEYMKFMLKIMEPEIFKDLQEQFKELDLTKDGFFTKKDLELISERQLQKLKLSKLRRQASIESP